MAKKLIKEGIIESILIFKNINDQVLYLNQKKVLDIGSGAGFLLFLILFIIQILI